MSMSLRGSSAESSIGASARGTDDGLYLDSITLKGTPVREKLRHAASVGFSGVRIVASDVREFLASGGTAAQLKELLRALHLRTPGFVPAPDVFDWPLGDPADPAFRRRIEATFDTATAIGAPCVVFPVMHAEGGPARLLANFRWLCRLAEERDLLAALEFIGHVPQVPDLRAAWQIVEATDHACGGLVIDVFHFYRGGSRLADLDAVPVDRIFMLDLDDAMDLPREELLGYKHRLYPGEGVAPVRELLAALWDKGFRGPTVVELFNDAYWADDPRTVAARALRTARVVLARASMK